MFDVCGAVPHIKLPSVANIGYLNYLGFLSPEVTSLVEVEISMCSSLVQVRDNKYENSNGGSTSFDYVNQESKEGWRI